MLRNICVLALTLIFINSCDSGNSKKVYTLRFGHIANESHTWHLAALKFKELVEQRSNGEMKVKVYPNSQIGNEADLINLIQLGVADMTITGESLQNWAPLAALIAYPYAFESSEEMRKVAASEAAKKIEEQITEKTDLVPLTWFERGPRYLTSNRPIKSPDDLKGLKIRVPDAPLSIKFWDALGAKPTPMAFGEVFTSLQQGAIEAQENPYSQIDNASFYEVQKYLNKTAHVRSWIYVVIGKNQLAKYPEHLQKIIKEAAVEAQAYENELFLKEEKKLEEKLKKAGMEFIDVDIKAFSEKAKEETKAKLSEAQRGLLEQFNTTK